MNLFDNLVYSALNGSGGGGGSDETLSRLIEKTDLEEITIPQGTNYIGRYCFYFCTKLKSVVINADITSIGSNAFQACSFLPSLDLPASLTAIDTKAFNGCSKLKTLILRGAPPSMASDSITGLPSDCEIYVPSQYVDAYKSASYWSARASHIQAL